MPVEIIVGSARSQGELENLTVEGVAFLADRPFEVDTAVVLVLAGGTKVKANILTAKVLRCHPAGAAGRYSVAAVLVAPDDHYLMDALALIHGGSGSGGEPT
jgi:hypothetical protein